MNYFKERNANFAFDQTSEDISFVNDKKEDLPPKRDDDLFMSERADDIYGSSTFIRPDQIPKALLEKQKGYKKSRKKRAYDMKPQKNRRYMRSTYQDFSVPKNNKTIDPVKASQGVPSSENLPHVLLTNAADPTPQFNSETTQDTNSVVTDDYDYFNDDFFDIGDFTLFPKKTDESPKTGE